MSMGMGWKERDAMGRAEARALAGGERDLPEPREARARKTARTPEQEARAVVYRAWLAAQVAKSRARNGF